MRVGTSNNNVTAIHTCEDHPHACGDKACCNPYKRRKAGSSPCVWGQVYRISIAKNTIRIIPMRVGTRLPTVTL